MKISLATTLIPAFFTASLHAAVLFTEGFETNGEAVRYTTTNSFTDGDSDYFMRTNGTEGSLYLPDYTGFGGSWFMAAEDIDSSDNPSQTAVLDITGIDISATANFTISLDVAAGYSGSFDAADDFLEVSYRIDNGSWLPALSFQNDGSQYNSSLFFDHDLDGIGSGDALGLELATFTSDSISVAAGNFLDLRVDAVFNAGGEAIAYDNVTVTAVPEPATTAIIAAFIAACLAFHRRLSPKRGHQQSRS